MNLSVRPPFVLKGVLSQAKSARLEGENYHVTSVSKVMVNNKV